MGSFVYQAFKELREEKAASLDAMPLRDAVSMNSD
jgi:hypothetical protein